MISNHIDRETSEPDAELLKLCEHFVQLRTYYERFAEQQGRAVWKTGLSRAEDLVRLSNADPIPLAELEAIVNEIDREWRTQQPGSVFVMLAVFGHALLDFALKRAV
jgi:hypothetical protein